MAALCGRTFRLSRSGEDLPGVVAMPPDKMGKALRLATEELRFAWLGVLRVRCFPPMAHKGVQGLQRLTGRAVHAKRGAILQEPLPPPLPPTTLEPLKANVPSESGRSERS